MKTVGVAEAKARLSELLDEVERGEIVELTRRGKVLARIVPARKERTGIDFDALRRLTANMSPPDRPFQQFLDEWKEDEERF